MIHNHCPSHYQNSFNKQHQLRHICKHLITLVGFLTSANVCYAFFLASPRHHFCHIFRYYSQNCKFWFKMTQWHNPTICHRRKEINNLSHTCFQIKHWQAALLRYKVNTSRVGGNFSFGRASLARSVNLRSSQ